MGTITLQKDPNIDKVFAGYPQEVQDKMIFLKDLIIETAEETEGVDELEMTLRWGEPSFVTKKGSTFRMDWKERAPGQYALYFQCTSRLVETFKIVYEDKFQFEGKRAIIFQLNQKLPIQEVKECIKAALTYHKVKHLMTLGI